MTTKELNELVTKAQGNIADLSQEEKVSLKSRLLNELDEKETKKYRSLVDKLADVSIKSEEDTGDDTEAEEGDEEQTEEEAEEEVAATKSAKKAKKSTKNSNATFNKNEVIDIVKLLSRANYVTTGIKNVGQSERAEKAYGNQVIRDMLEASKTTTVDVLKFGENYAAKSAEGVYAGRPNVSGGTEVSTLVTREVYQGVFGIDSQGLSLQRDAAQFSTTGNTYDTMHIAAPTAATQAEATTLASDDDGAATPVTGDITKTMVKISMSAESLVDPDIDLRAYISSRAANALGIQIENAFATAIGMASATKHLNLGADKFLGDVTYANLVKGFETVEGQNKRLYMHDTVLYALLGKMDSQNRPLFTFSGSTADGTAMLNGIPIRISAGLPNATVAGGTPDASEQIMVVADMAATSLFARRSGMEIRSVYNAAKDTYLINFIARAVGVPVDAANMFTIVTKAA